MSEAKEAVLFKGVPENEEAPKVLLMGQPGAGKTYALASLLKAGLEVFVIFTEQGKESLLEACIETEAPMDKLHWARVSAGSPGFGSLKKIAKTINRSTQKDMQGEKGIDNQKYQQMIDLIGLCEDFVDQHGVSYGNATEWGNDRCLVIDGLSGINTMCMDLVVGAKPVKTIADWGIAMDAEMRFINQCVNSLTAMFVLVAHLELNKDEVEGRIYKYPKVLGNKNTYDFGKHFSDVVLATDEGSKFSWSTEAKNMQLKTRNLQRSSKLKPDFVPLVEKWASRYAKAEEVDE
jgi:broad-specificity NMP kinase